MEELMDLVASERITKKIADRLQALTPGTFCTHRSWGIGQVNRWDVESASVVVDFDNKREHVLGMEFAADSLTPLGQDHIAARVRRDAEAVKAQALEHPLDVVRNVIESLGLDATADRIEQMLCPRVVSADHWKLWWTNVKREMRKDGRFLVPPGKTALFRVIEREVPKEADPGTFPLLKGIPSQLDALTALMVDPSKVEARKAEYGPLCDAVEASLRKPPPTQRPAALKLALLRDTLCEIIGREPAADAGTAFVFGLLGHAAAEVVLRLDGPSQRLLLEALRKAMPEEWPAVAARFLGFANTRLVSEVRELFHRHGMVDRFVEVLRRGVREQSLSSDAMVWIFRNRNGDTKGLVEPRLFTALIAAIERDQMSDRRANRLRDLVLSDAPLLTDLLVGTDADSVRDVTRGLMLSTVFDDMDKRSLLARIIKVYPDMENLVRAPVRDRSADSEAASKASGEEGVLLVSWPSLKKRKEELEDITNKKIPANSQEILIARSYGDLSENAEFKFAKEQQAVLQRRQAELEADIVRAQGTDFADVDPTSVGPGCCVLVAPVAGGPKEEFSILGAWDSDPAHGVVSYLTPLARALMGKRQGDVALLPTESGTPREVRVELIGRADVATLLAPVTPKPAAAKPSAAPDAPGGEPAAGPTASEA